MGRMRKVMFFKEADERYGKTIRDMRPEWEVEYCPLLKYEFFESGCHELRKVVEEIEDGLLNIIVTSPRAAEVVRQVLIDDEISFQCRVFVVGKGTKDVLSQLNSERLEIVGEQCGTGKKLAEYVRQRISEDQVRSTVIFVCGEKHRPDIPQLLEEINETQRYNNIKLTKELIVYRSVPIVPKIALHEVDIAVVFSPSGANTLLNAPSIQEGQERTVVAIGNTTGDYLKRHVPNWNILVAEQPSAQGVAAALNVAFPL